MTAGSMCSDVIQLREMFSPEVIALLEECFLALGVQN